MYYKVTKDGNVVDVLTQLIFVKFQPKHKRMVLCDENEAQGILSSDKNKIWHEVSLYKIPVSGYETVKVEEIDEFEYRRLKVFGGKTPEEVIDLFMSQEILPMLLAMEGGKR